MIESRDGREVVVTGVGVVSPAGIGAEAFWAGLSRPVEDATTREVTGFDPADWGLTKQQVRRTDRFVQFALAASAQALADAGYADDGLDDPERWGIVIGSGIGGALSWETQAYVLRDSGPRKVSPFTVPMVMPNGAAGAVSIRYGLRGPCETISTACATGTHSVAAAARLVASGRVDRAIAGGSESCMTGTNVAAFGNMRALSPTGRSRPFDPDRDGFCAAEAAGCLVLETAESAASRGARVYAKVAGAASTADAFHITAPAPGGAGAARCMRLAIEDAGVRVEDVTHVNAHGTSTELNDAAEAEAINAVFGAHRPVVTSIKGVTGHSLGAAGAVEAVALALTYKHRTIPPTIGTSTVDEKLDLDVALTPREWQPGVALSNSFAFGGHNGTLVFTPAGTATPATAV
ncbi:beta-ketoacyl-[acyl-carrier-protein] synthase family protein [Fodinicola acaciae]|uniref:beta-ketoacyl-[acyl-carrier-protein] synthase family protein n=1 Tax=Fodinicola acaciae TaxID=2681555 RepID=UPI0013D6D484|nr:beta-ketoacyl-ACP synthase II [Fodinicola acaciae]